MARGKRDKDKRRPRRKTPDRRPPPCKVMRLGIVIGSQANEALNVAAQWLMQRAQAQGGAFRLWYSPSSTDPLQAFRDTDIEGGFLHAGGEQYYESPSSGQKGYGQVLADCAHCRGRIEELVIFHHGGPVNEATVGDRLGKIFDAIEVPICRVVWWACNADVSLDVDEGHWTDSMMRRLGKHSRCQPCGCSHPIELVWPTAGRCYLSGPGANDTLQTNDGQVKKARWGWPQPDGSLGMDPQPISPDGTVSRTPTDRDPPFGQPIPPQAGSVLGSSVTQKP